MIVYTDIDLSPCAIEIKPEDFQRVEEIKAILPSLDVKGGEYIKWHHPVSVIVGKVHHDPEIVISLHKGQISVNLGYWHEEGWDSVDYSLPFESYRSKKEIFTKCFIYGASNPMQLHNLNKWHKVYEYISKEGKEELRSLIIEQIKKDIEKTKSLRQDVLEYHPIIEVEVYGVIYGPEEEDE